MIKLSKERIFCFGKYKGHNFTDVLTSDLQYLDYISSKLTWLFNDFEKQQIKNMRNCIKNKDVYLSNVKYRTPFEEEMYNVLRKM